jgi:hypothetical protein
MKEVLGLVNSLVAGDLVLVEWCDASIGKSLSNGLSGIDVPVKSWGVFIGVLGQKRRHVVLAQNCFRYSDGLYDIDYMAVPLSWTSSATVVVKGHVGVEEAENLKKSFLVNEKAKGEKASFDRRRTTRQQRVRNHD